MTWPALSILAGLVLLASPAWGAIAEMGGGTQRASTQAGNVDSANLAYPGNVTTNSLLVILGSTWPATGKPIAASGCSVSWSVLTGPEVPANGFVGHIDYGLAVSSAACTVTVNPASTGNFLSFTIDEFSGVNQSTPLDVDGLSTTGNGTAVSDALTTLTANALIVGVMWHSGSGSPTLTPGGSYTQVGEIESTANSPHNAVFRLATTATSYTVDWTLGAVHDWGAMTAAFKEASAAAGGSGGLLLWGIGR